MKRWLYPLLISLAVLVIFADLLRPEPPLTHDSQNHLARMANYYLALKQGQIPPRWAPTLNNGFGYPVFNYNYPLANILALPLIILNFPVQTSFSLLTIMALLLSGLGMYYFLKKTYGDTPALIGGLLYVLNPYQLSLVYVRGVIGETLSFALLPWLLICIRNFNREKSWQKFIPLSLIAAAFILSHNIIVLFSLPLITIYALWTTRTNIKKLFTTLAAGLTAAALTAFFWLPALVEIDYITLKDVPLSQGFLQHFPTLAQLLHSPFTYGFSHLSPVDGMSFFVGFAQIIIFLTALLLWISSDKTWKGRNILWILAATFLLFVSLLPISRPIWQSLSFTSYIQFPWRLLFFLQFLLSVIGAWVVWKLKKRALASFTLITFLLITGLQLARPFSTFSHSDEYWFTYPQSTSIQDENMPRLFNKASAYQLDEMMFNAKPVYATPSAQIDIQSWHGSKHTFTVNAQEETQIVERTAYFPGWQVRVNGKAVPIDPTVPTFSGLITYSLPKGEHRVETQFTQKTPARLAGNLTSGISFLGLVSFGIFHLVNQRSMQRKKSK